MFDLQEIYYSGTMKSIYSLCMKSGKRIIDDEVNLLVDLYIVCVVLNIRY